VPDDPELQRRIGSEELRHFHGKEAWVEAEKGNGVIWLRIVEKQEMQQHVVADAASFGNDLKATGHVAVYGIRVGKSAWSLQPGLSGLAANAAPEPRRTTRRASLVFIIDLLLPVSDSSPQEPD
jgi:hypothetical protein